MRETSIHMYFSDMEDPRLDRRKKHPLINVIFIAFCAVLCGAEDWVAIAKFGRSRIIWLNQFLDMDNGIPSHDTFNRVFAILEPTYFTSCFMSWVESLTHKLKKTVAIDGKSMRATRNEKQGLGPLHMVNVWCCENQLALGQQVVSGKSNEITAIPMLLELLTLEGATISIDAMGCQKEISAKIRNKNAHYVLSLKGNHGNLHDDVKLYFRSLETNKIKTDIHQYHSLQKDHGRVEERMYSAVALPTGVRADGWHDLVSIVKVYTKQTNIVSQKISEETRYFISSLAAEAISEVALSIREHWQVETALHWRLDVCFNEDRWCSKLGHAAANIAILNKMALNVLKKEATAKVGIKNKRLMAGWDEAYLTKVIMGV